MSDEKKLGRDPTPAEALAKIFTMVKVKKDLDEVGEA